MTQDVDLNISKEFIEENKLFIPKELHRKGGPYNKNERLERRNEVHRLHFEYGYSAVKISKIMKINRNTINGDIDYWYSKIITNNSIYNPEYAVIITLQRFEIQRSRLREQLDKTISSYQERLAIERMIYEIDSKILQIYQRLTDSTRRVMDISTQRLNNWMKENKKPDRYMSLFDKIIVSEKAREKINKIIDEDKKKRKNL